jgi:hypothetical protein
LRFVHQIAEHIALLTKFISTHMTPPGVGEGALESPSLFVIFFFIYLTTFFDLLLPYSDVGSTAIIHHPSSPLVNIEKSHHFVDPGVKGSCFVFLPWFHQVLQGFCVNFLSFGFCKENSLF